MKSVSCVVLATSLVAAPALIEAPEIPRNVPPSQPSGTFQRLNS